MFDFILRNCGIMLAIPDDLRKLFTHAVVGEVHSLREMPPGHLLVTAVRVYEAHAGGGAASDDCLVPHTIKLLGWEGVRGRVRA